MFHHPTGDAVLSVDDLDVTAGTRTLLRDATLRASAGEVTTLAGPNGCGKSTLLAVVATTIRGEPIPGHVTTSGSIRAAPHTRIGWLPQEVRLQWHGTAGSWFERISGNAAGLLRRHEDVQRRLQDSQDAALLGEYGDLLAEMERAGAWDFEIRRDEVFAALGCDAGWLHRDVNTLSGGEATRTALAGVILGNAELVLLDEPTNNLDADGIEFLARWLHGTHAAVLMVSHDRAFADRVATAVVAIDEATHTATTYGGGYSFYETQRAGEMAAAQRAWEQQENRRRRLVEASSALAGRARRFNAMSQNDFQRSKAKKAARQSTTMARRIRRDMARLGQPEPPRPARMVAAAVDDSDGRLVALRSVSFGFERIDVLHDVTLDIRAGERIAIEGRNGSGKSTLLGIIGGSLIPGAGDVLRRADLRVVHLSQTPESVDPAAPLLDTIARLVAVPPRDLRPILGAVVFRDVGRTRAGEVSVGERRRLETAAILAAGPDLLILDEVTNHMDVQTIEHLERGLETFRGALVAVSHDRRFLENLRIQRSFRLDDRRLSAG